MPTFVRTEPPDTQVSSILFVYNSNSSVNTFWAKDDFISSQSERFLLLVTILDASVVRFTVLRWGNCGWFLSGDQIGNIVAEILRLEEVLDNLRGSVAYCGQIFDASGQGAQHDRERHQERRGPPQVLRRGTVVLRKRLLVPIYTAN